MYCYSCGQRLDAEPPTTCAACAVPHYGNAVPCASCFVTDAQRVLLIKRGTEPYKGWWDCPSGFCEPGEHPIATAEREMLEETGLVVRVTSFLGIWLGNYDVPADPEPRKALLNVVYLAEPTGGELTPTTEAPESRWFAPGALPWNDLYPEKRPALETWRTTLLSGEPPTLPDHPSSR